MATVAGPAAEAVDRELQVLIVRDLVQAIRLATPLGVQDRTLAPTVDGHEVDIAPQRATGERSLNVELGRCLHDIGVGEVAQQQCQGPLERGDDLLAVDAAAVLEQHGAFPLDEIVDRGCKPGRDVGLVERSPVGVLREEALEEPMREGALQQTVRRRRR